jgi:hypothetical protein
MRIENLFEPEEPLMIIAKEADVLPRAFRYIIDNNSSNHAPYHHLNHMLRVMSFCNEGCKYHRLTGKSRTNLLVAALFHDFNHTMGEKPDDANIQNAIQGVQLWYSSNPLNSTNINIERVIEIIKATQYPYVINQEDLTLEQSIIRDADLMVPLESDWVGNLIVGLSSEMKINDFKKMAEGQYKFYSGVVMNSPWGIEVQNKLWPLVFENLGTLRQLI